MIYDPICSLSELSEMQLLKHNYDCVFQLRHSILCL